MSSSTSTACNVSANVTFIDLATFGELDAFYYGGSDAVTWNVISVQKSSWFSFVPITLRQQGIFDFGQRQVSVTLNRSGDYVLSVWFRMQLPQVELTGLDVGSDATIRWTRNFMHNIFEKVSISHNELVVHEFDNFWLDFVYQFSLPASKRIGYRNMIGDVSALTSPVLPNTPLGTGGFLSVPLPFWFTADSGVALPVAALPFNEIRVNYCFRNWQDLIVLDLGTTGGTIATKNTNIRQVNTDAVPAMVQPETYAHYSVVHNDERVKMGDAPRDMPCIQTQMVSATPVNTTLSVQEYDIRLSHSIIQWFYVYRNRSTEGEFSNYTSEPNYTGLDPISQSRMQYESTDRVAMGSDYYSLIAPYYYAKAIPDQTGYHMYSYALHPWKCAKPSGSTNFSKLANVRMIHTLSQAAVNASAAAPVDQDGDPITRNTGTTPEAFPQRFEHIFQAANWNVVRVANGSLGQPVL